MTPTISPMEIEQQIHSDIAACNTLLQLLEQEQEALKERDAESLAKVVEQKTPPLMQLETSAKQRAKWANIQDYSEASDKWNELMQSLQKDSIKEDWNTLKTLTRECQQKNEVNGKILVRHQQVFGRLLEIMRGQTRAPSLYNAAGAATNLGSSFKVDEA